MKLHLIAALLYLTATGCSSTRITSSWTIDSIPSKKYQKILIVALVPNDDRNMRSKMEHHFVGDLTEHGCIAVSSAEEFGVTSFNAMTDTEVLGKLHDKQVDAVVTIVLLDKQKERYYIPARVYYSPYSVYHNHFLSYYNAIYGRIYSPGYYQTDTRYFWECNLYDPNSKQLLYSVQTVSFDPGSAETLAHEFGKKITANMLKKGLFR